jgi:hypothetical protein
MHDAGHGSRRLYRWAPQDAGGTGQASGCLQQVQQVARPTAAAPGRLALPPRCANTVWHIVWYRSRQSRQVVRDATSADQGGRWPARRRATCRPCVMPLGGATAAPLPPLPPLPPPLRYPRWGPPPLGSRLVLVQVGKSAVSENDCYRSGRSSLPSSYSYNKRSRLPRPAAPLPSLARPSTPW